MGRLFKYNRFGTMDNHDKSDNNNKRDTTVRSDWSTYESQSNERRCPAYSELYPQYNDATTTSTSNSLFPYCPSSSSSSSLFSSTTTATATKSLETAIKKYQQWSNKLLSTTAITTTTTTTPSITATMTAATALEGHPSLISTSSSTSSTSSSSSASSSASSSSTATTASSYFCSTSSGYHSRHVQDNDREMLISNTFRRPKVYDCMKDFLKRKLFQQNITETNKKLPQHNNVDFNEKHTTFEDDDTTSDYDELDIMDSSYNADEEDVTDCCSNCSYTSESSCSIDADNNDHHLLTPSTKSINMHRKSKNSPLRSPLSLSNCWQSISQVTDSTTDEEVGDDEKNQQIDDDSDAGISDCCQLINEISPKRKSPQKKCSDDELPELLEFSWYQPRMSTKSAMMRLQQSEPGTFLMRRKAHTYELCLRADSKVKRYTVISAEDNYQLKGARKQFSSLKAFVTHHSVMAEQLPVTLILPHSEKHSYGDSHKQRYADDFDTYESLQILGILKNLQAKNFELS